MSFLQECISKFLVIGFVAYFKVRLREFLVIGFEVYLLVNSAV